MTIPKTPDIESRLDEYKAYISSENTREAFNFLIHAARKDERYSFFPHEQGALNRTIRYLVGSSWCYGFIVNQSDLLFYYRMPSARTSTEVLGSLQQKGLIASHNKRGEIRVRIASLGDARLILDDCFGVNSIGATQETGGTDWNDEELRASIQAYREMQQLHRDGHSRFKKQIYGELFKKFGRTEKAFEFRMQNISAVLSLLGREWIEGLKPATHVGAGVASRLEALINEVDGTQASPAVAFEIAVREKVAHPPSTAPTGTLTPQRTSATVTNLKRDPAVKAWVLCRAKGICECCGCVAPFEGVDGMGYLEVHHLRRLADGGSDRISNAVALCPNCHRRMHFGKDAATVRAQTISQISELEAE
jgi:5-methylcytosine-specific restriction protein A